MLAGGAHGAPQPDGRLYDSCGIEPDLALVLGISDVLGQTDSALEAALEWIRDSQSTSAPRRERGALD